MSDIIKPILLDETGQTIVTAIENLVNARQVMSSSKVDKVSGSSLVPDTKVASYDEHIENKENPHEVTKEQLGLGNVDNTADADKSVSYATSSGNAGSLSTTSTENESCYDSRQTFNSEDGACVVNTIKGKSMVMNQFAHFVAGYRCTYTHENGVYTITGTGDNNAQVIMSENLIYGHHYIAVFDAFSSTSSTHVTLIFSDIDIPISDAFSRYYAIGSVETSDSNPIYFNNTKGDGYSFKDTFQLIDLTQMFGSGNEPSTVDEFAQALGYSSIDEVPYFAYNTGEVTGTTPTEIVKTGVNLWDEEWEIGYVNPDTGENQLADDAIRCKGYIPLSPSTSYYIRTTYTGSANKPVISYYDSNKVFISGYYTGGNSAIFVTPSNTAYIRFGIGSIAPTYNHDICINISDDSVNGTYYPYEEHKIELPQYDGSAITLHGINDVHDEIDLARGKYIKRIGSKVFDGTESWSISGKILYVSLTDTLENAKSYGNCISNTYIISKAFDGDKCIVIDGDFNVVDSSYTDAASFKQHLSDLYTSGTPLTVYYELATPEEYDLPKMASDIKVVGLGMEKNVYTGIAPIINATYNKGDGGKLMSLPCGSDLDTKKADKEIELGKNYKTPVEYVDLGLPSGLLWAKCNLGASSETGYGNYYGWGMTTPYNVGTDSTDNYSTYSAAKISSDLIGSEDVANVLLGNGWRMPSKDEMQELLDNTTRTLEEISGIKGCKFTASNGNYIFIPLSGCFTSTSVSYSTSYGYAWSKNISNEKPIHMVLSGADVSFNSYGNALGFSIRPVISVSDLSKNTVSTTVNEKLATLEAKTKCLEENGVDKLKTQRTIWGQSFNGSADISGAMTGVTDVNGSQLVFSSGEIDVNAAAMFNRYNTYGNTYGAAIVINKGGDFFGIGPSSGNISNIGFGHTSNATGTWKSEFVTINEYGFVGIGNTSPSAKLDVNGNFKIILTSAEPSRNVVQILNLGTYSSTGARNWAIRGVYQYDNGVGLNAEGGDLDALKVSGGNTILATKTDGTLLGKVGVGTTAPSYTLHVNGSVAGTSWTATSDIRYKDKIEDKEISIDYIAEAPVFSFKWNKEEWDDKEHIGSSAQYWKEKVPEAVSHDETNDIYGLDYAALSLASVVSLAKQVKAQKEEIDSLKSENESLKERLAKLESLVETLINK